jgi:hypothetical protein
MGCALSAVRGRARRRETIALLFDTPRTDVYAFHSTPDAPAAFQISTDDTATVLTAQGGIFGRVPVRLRRETLWQRRAWVKNIRRDILYKLSPGGVTYAGERRGREYRVWIRVTDAEERFNPGGVTVVAGVVNTDLCTPLAFLPCVNENVVDVRLCSVPVSRLERRRGG